MNEKQPLLIVSGFLGCAFGLAEELLRSSGLQPVSAILPERSQKDSNTLPDHINQRNVIAPVDKRSKKISYAQYWLAPLASDTTTNTYPRIKDVSEASSIANQLPFAKFIFLFLTPEETLNNALAAGDDPFTTLQKWTQTSQFFIEFKKKYRNRSILINSSALQNAQNLADALSTLEFNVDCKKHDGLKLQRPQHSPIATIIARQIIREHPDIASIYGALEASAIPLQPDNHDEEFSAEQLYSEFATYKNNESNLRTQLEALDHSYKELASKNDTAQLDNRLFLEELQASHTELSQTIKLLSSLSQEKESLISQLTDSQQHISKTHAELEYSKSTITSIELQKNQINLEREAVERRFQETEKKNSELEQQLNHLKENIKLSEANNKRLIQEIAKASVDHKATQEIVDKNKALEDTNHRLQLDIKKLELSLSHAQEGNDILVRQTAELQRNIEIRETAEKEIQVTPPSNVTPPKGPRAWPLKLLITDPRRHSRYVKVISESELFDSDWYIRQYPDVAEAKIEPARHYVLFGAHEGRDPSTQFSTSYYLAKYPDVAASEINPLAHYILFGKNEGRSTKTR